MNAAEDKEAPVAESVLEFSATETRVVVRGELGHRHWTLVRQACDLAKRNNCRLILDLSGCTTVNRWGIGVILRARERAGSIILFGCSDRLTYYFDGLGICGVCGKRADPGCGGRRAEFRQLSPQEFRARYGG